MASKARKHKVGELAERMLTGKPMTPDAIAGTIRKRVKGAKTSRDSVLWYAAKLRKENKTVTMKGARSG